MKIYNVCFSATGRAKAVAENSLLRAEGEKEFVDLSDPNMPRREFTKDDLCLVTVSVYGGRVPAPARANMRKLAGNGAAAFLLAVYGNRAVDDTLIEMGDILREQGFVVVGAAEAVAQHSIATDVASDRPNRQDKEQVRGYFAATLSRLREAGKDPDFTPRKFMEGKKVNLPGKRPYVKASALPVRPAAGKACTFCGLCRQKCPAGAIPLENPRETDKTKCITCMRCVEICPVGARQLPSMLLKVAKPVLNKSLGGVAVNRYYPAE